MRDQVKVGAGDCFERYTKQIFTLSGVKSS